MRSLPPVASPGALLPRAGCRPRRCAQIGRAAPAAGGATPNAAALRRLGTTTPPTRTSPPASEEDAQGPGRPPRTRTSARGDAPAARTGRRRHGAAPKRRRPPDARPDARRAACARARSRRLRRRSPRRRRRCWRPRPPTRTLGRCGTRWRKAANELDLTRTRRRRKELLKLRDELGATDLEALQPWASCASRRASSTRPATSPARCSWPGRGGALPEPAVLRASRSPRPTSRRARRAWAATRRGQGRAARRMLRDPRYLRPALADLGAIGAARRCSPRRWRWWLVLFLRRRALLPARLPPPLPRAAARWQSGALAAASC